MSNLLPILCSLPSWVGKFFMSSSECGPLRCGDGELLRLSHPHNCTTDIWGRVLAQQTCPWLFREWACVASNGILTENLCHRCHRWSHMEPRVPFSHDFSFGALRRFQNHTEYMLFCCLWSFLFHNASFACVSSSRMLTGNLCHSCRRWSHMQPRVPFSGDFSFGALRRFQNYTEYMLFCCL